MISIKILGVGCKKCQRLEDKIRDLVKKNQINAQIEKVSDIDEMVKYGIMMTPGLIINEEVKSVGIIPKEDQLISWINGEEK